MLAARKVVAVRMVGAFGGRRLRPIRQRSNVERDWLPKVPTVAAAGFSSGPDHALRGYIQLSEIPKN